MFYTRKRTGQKETASGRVRGEVPAGNSPDAVLITTRYLMNGLAAMLSAG